MTMRPKQMRNSYLKLSENSVVWKRPLNLEVKAKQAEEKRLPAADRQ